MKIYYGLVFVLLIGMISCTSSVKEKSKNGLISDLEDVKGKGILFGHQDDLAYGMEWSYVGGQSDVKLVAGDYPAMFGWELGGIELEHSHNLDSVPFSAMHRLAIFGHKQGGINTFSWHPFSPIDSISSWNGDSVVVKHLLQTGAYHGAFKKQLDKVGLFLQSLKDENGKTIPFIFRPWHEMDGGWFWWGKKACTPTELRELFRFTVSYLKSNYNLSEMVVAYSPDRNFSTAEEYLSWYPGDDIVDVLGMDDYWDFKQKGGENDVIEKLHLIIELANKKNKLAALTETGFENVTDSLWFTSKLGKVFNDEIIRNNLSYAMVWRNDPKVHFFFPYPGHKAATDAKTFLNQDHILLLENYKKIK